MLSDGTAYADIVEFFAANLNKETVNGVVRPTLYLNDKMTNLLENGGAATYVAGLQAKGIKARPCLFQLRLQHVYQHFRRNQGALCTVVDQSGFHR